MLGRERWVARVRAALRRSRVVALVGPRQAGKTTLARAIVPSDSTRYFDLEDPVSLSTLATPMTALASLRGTVVIDEIQRRPELFPVLRVLADRVPLPARFLILGSASPDLLRQSSESLAGRLEVITLDGLSLDEVADEADGAVIDRLWFRGGFPQAYLARSERASLIWRQQFVQTYLERDLPLLGLQVPAATLTRFWTMVAHYHGNIWNTAEAARALGTSEPTARRYLDILAGMYLVRAIAPWHENLQKRQVKSPKVYVRDSGLLHALLGVPRASALRRHPKVGASWEGFVLEEVIRLTMPDSVHFWATHSGAELDLLLHVGGLRYGVEAKFQDAPSLTRSMQSALTDLRLEHLTVLYPGSRQYSLAPRVTVVPLSALAARGRAAILSPRR